jgi:CheY-like chemotaxis protein
MGPFSDLSVLLVEDEYLIALDAEQILKELGVAKVEIASTLPRAEERAAKGGIDIAVLDVNLNGQFSFPFANTLRERGVPVVFASGYELRDRAPAAFEGGVCVTKPYTTERLREALSAALGNK